MSDDLRSRLNELETTVDALTDEIMEIQQRLDEMEDEDGEPREEVGVGTDAVEEDEKDDDTDIDTDDDIRVA